LVKKGFFLEERRNEKRRLAKKWGGQIKKKTLVVRKDGNVDPGVEKAWLRGEEKGKKRLF